MRVRARLAVRVALVLAVVAGGIPAGSVVAPIDVTPAHAEPADRADAPSPAKMTMLATAMAAESVLYAPPVRAPVIDPFRPPGHIGAPGNRGLLYDNPPWVMVTAAATGLVVFAGQVFGSGTVVIAHADGVRTTYNGLAEIWVRAGMSIELGQAVGLAGTTVHFGAKRRNAYVDPQILLDASTPERRVVLIPVPPS